MYVTQHARDQLTKRLGPTITSALVSALESMDGERGTVAYIMGTLRTPVRTEDGSNGDTVVCVATDGSVHTGYLRRRGQDMRPEFFGASRVVDRRGESTCEGYGWR